MTSDEERNDDGKSIRRFIFLVFLIGGFMPTVGVFCVDKVLNFNLVPEAHERLFNVGFFVLCVTASLIFIAVIAPNSKHPRFVINCLRFTSLPIYFALHILVLATGGAASSPFALHYIYIPTVIAVAFKPRLMFYVCAGLSGFSFFWNLFFLIAQLRWLELQPAQDWPVIAESLPFKVIYFSVFLFQLVVAVILEILTERGK